MPRSINLLQLILLVILSSCAQEGSTVELDGKKEPKLTTRVTFYANGNIKTVKQFMNDTIQQGYYKAYSEDGSLLVVMHFKDDKRHGIATWYYRDGVVQEIRHYKSGVLHGISKRFSTNGQLTGIVNMENGVRVGESAIYNSNGTPINYMFLNQTGKVKYRVDYIEDGRIAMEEGTGFPLVMVNTDKLFVRDTFRAEINVIWPPHANAVYLYIGDIGRSGDLVNQEKVKLKNGKYFYTRIWENPGDKKWGARLKIESTKPRAKDSFEFSMSVTVTEP